MCALCWGSIQNILSAFRHQSLSKNITPGISPRAKGRGLLPHKRLIGMGNLFKYIYIYIYIYIFVLLFCLLLHRLAVRISLPFHIVLMGMCRWTGSHFHDWIAYNGVSHFRIFWGKIVLHING